MDNQLRQIIEEAWNDRALLAESRVREAVRAVIEELDKGRLRTAEPIDPSRSQWQVNEWVKKAILLYFPMQEMRTMRAGELEWHDKWTSSTATRNWAYGSCRTPWPATGLTFRRGRS